MYVCYHQRKLQLVLTTMCASGVFAPVHGRKTPPVQGAKVSQHQGKLQQDGATACYYSHHNTDQIRTSTDAVVVPDAQSNL